MVCVHGVDHTKRPPLPVANPICKWRRLRCMGVRSHPRESAAWSPDGGTSEEAVNTVVPSVTTVRNSRRNATFAPPVWAWQRPATADPRHQRAL